MPSIKLPVKSIRASVKLQYLVVESKSRLYSHGVSQIFFFFFFSFLFFSVLEFACLLSGYLHPITGCGLFE